MKKYFLTAILTSTALFANLSESENQQKVGFVNFNTCVTASKLGKHEQQAAEKVLTNMRELIEDREKGLKDLQAKFSDSDYMDGLNPAAAEELKGQFQALQEEYGRYQQQYMQVAQQAQMRVMQTVQEHSRVATEKLAREHSLTCVLPSDYTLYYNSAFDFTDQVIVSMDQEFEKQNPGKTANE